MILEKISKRTDKRTHEIIEVNTDDLNIIYNITRQDLLYRTHFLYFESDNERLEFFEVFEKTNFSQDENEHLKFKIISYRKLDFLTEKGKELFQAIQMVQNTAKKENKDISVNYTKTLFTINVGFGSYSVNMVFDWQFNMIDEYIIPSRYDDVLIPFNDYFEFKKEFQKTLRNFRYYNI